ncbi:unnamed protein product [Cyclocybe aegerita]|uniref:C3H1-type domain-containing protein n=1 Tax=Cyclocybe aegerita TaxID=1973307 RepID=A0A8S0W4D2_CYCAE|nr:unnamed protein product [Cyclocybe aegerita]
MPADAAYHHESDRDIQRDHDRMGDIDRADRTDKGGSKHKPASSSKSKDLSHVPCKFFKVGGCTAGSSCPFSHTAAEPGAQKETCTWFVKGNCKFGHKCALAHVLPGQSMAMDRKNKKAAQVAAQQANAGMERGGKVTRGGKRDQVGGANGGAGRLLAGGSTAPTRIIGAPTTSRPQMLKATISPSAPAPPLKDTDFASFATLDELDDIHLASQKEAKEADGKEKEETKDKETKDPLPPSAPRPAVSSTNATTTDFGPIGSPPNYRPGQPTSPTRPVGVNGATFSPGTSPRAHSHLNGVNIGSSPSANGNPGNNATAGGGLLSSSPFSAPGTQTHFPSSSYSTGYGHGTQGIAASLGSGLAMMGGRKGWGDVDVGSPGKMNVGPSSYSVSGLLSAQMAGGQGGRSNGLGGAGGRGEYDISIEYEDFGGARRGQRGQDVAVEDEDLEDFLPSSLNDLLTPEERSRRMSRSNSGQAKPLGISHLSHALAEGNGNGANGGGAGGVGHRYSRSVPAPTLLGDIKSIWADNTTSQNPHTATTNQLTASGLPSSPPIHRGTPSSSAYAAADAAGLSMSMGSAGTASSMGMMSLSPSNASAAFLPGLHHHYKAKQQAQMGVGPGVGPGGIARQLRGTSNPLFSNTGPGAAGGAGNSGASGPGGANPNSLASNYLQPLGLGLPGSPGSSSVHTHTHGGTQTTYRTTPSPFDLTQTLHQHNPLLQHAGQPHTARPIPSGLTTGGGDDAHLAPQLISPSSRALQAHAPGQSLPQGLAAGYSRIHALPPLTHIASPPASASFAPKTPPAREGLAFGSSLGGISEGPYGEMPPLPPLQHQHQHQHQGQQQPGFGSTTNTASNTAGLETMFSRLSYSAATRSGPGGISAAGPPPGLSRNVSGGRYGQQAGVGAGPLSPLSGPVVSRDDDDLFDMDK